MFLKKDLLKDDRPHHYLILSRLHPTTNISEITLERAEFLYAMRNGLSFGIGRVIENSIYAMGKHKGKKFYGLASLITRLCHMAIVRHEPGDVPAPTGRLLDQAHVARLDGNSASKNENENEDEDEEDATECEQEIPMVPPPRSCARARAPTSSA